MHVQDQAPPEAGGGSGEGGGLSYWQRTGLLKTWRLVHVSTLHYRQFKYTVCMAQCTYTCVRRVYTCRLSYTVYNRRLIPVRKDIEVVGGKMTKHSDECAQHLQAQDMVCG